MLHAPYTAQTAHTQLSATVTALSARAPRSTPRLTDRERLEKRALARNAMAEAEAKITAPYCRAVACDPYENTVSFRKAGRATVIHTINLNTGECDCILQESVNGINAQLVAERSEIRCVGKCRRIVDLLEAADPECFLNAPLIADPFDEVFAMETI